ncbi:MAG: gliding motility lipoprotein GldB, partial [Bacteroidetes bacterium]
KAQIYDVLLKNPVFARDYMRQSKLPHDSLMINDFFRIANSPYIDTLNREVKKYFGDLSDIQSQLDLTFRLVKHYYPKFEAPIVYTTVTGFGNDIFVSDSLIIIGLDYFLGANSRYRPPDVPNYMMRRYKKETIVPLIALFMSNRYNEISDDKTLLADMIFHGKGLYFAKKVCPVPDSLIIGYTSKEWQGATENQAFLWGHFVENNLFFEKSILKKRKYIDEAPFVSDISSECPGRIGRWLAWQIVKKYMERQKEPNLPDLMKTSNAQQIFEQAKFKPQ